MTIPPPHNLTIAGGNTSSYVAFLQTINTNLLNGMFGTMLLITLFGISFMLSLSLTKSANKSFIFSCFGVFIISVFLRLIELVPDLIMYVCLGLAALSVALVKNE